MASRALAPGLSAVLLLCLLASADARPRIPRTGPCSTQVTAANTMYVRTVEEFMSRRAISNTTTVLMYLSNNLTLADTLAIGPEFSCTVIRADPALMGTMPFIDYRSDDRVALRLNGVTNLMMIGVGVVQNWTYNGQKRCDWASQRLHLEPWTDTWWTCPGTLIYNSFNILVSQAYLGGRTDIWRSGNVEITYSELVSDNNSTLARAVESRALNIGFSYGTLRIMSTGDPVGLVRGNNRIAHNVIRGSDSTVFLYWQAVGNIIQNNFITDFGFAGLQCGMGMRNVADCMLNTFELNYVMLTNSSTSNADGAGIYYDLHWFNPGNRDSCNYIENTIHCYYVDYASSGLIVDGGVCINTKDGIKGNTGSFNTYNSIVMYSDSLYFNTGFLSCMNWCINRCGEGKEQEVAQLWWTTFQRTYNNEMWNTNYPYLQDFCTATGYRGYDGVWYPCNPSPALTTVWNPGSVGGGNRPMCYTNMTYLSATNTYMSAPANLSGNCSGLPKYNTHDIIFTSPHNPTGNFFRSRYLPTFQDAGCNVSGPFVYRTNILPVTLQAMPRNMNGSLGFNDENGWFGPRDFGADDPSALVYQRYPNFFSCPRRLVGPQTASFAQARGEDSLYKKMNRRRPKRMAKTDPDAGKPADLWKELSILEYVTKKFGNAKNANNANRKPAALRRRHRNRK